MYVNWQIRLTHPPRSPSYILYGGRRCCIIRRPRFLYYTATSNFVLYGDRRFCIIREGLPAARDRYLFVSGVRHFALRVLSSVLSLN